MFFCDMELLQTPLPLVSHLSQKIFSFEASLLRNGNHRRTSSTALMFIHTNLNFKILDIDKQCFRDAMEIKGNICYITLGWCWGCLG